MENLNYKSAQLRNEKNDFSRKVGFYYVFLLLGNKNRRKKFLF